MSNFTKYTAFFWFLMMARGYCDYRWSASAFECKHKISLLVYSRLCTDSTQQRKTVYAQGIVLVVVKVTHNVCEWVNEWVTEYVNSHEIVYAQGIVVILTKVSVFVCVCRELYHLPWSISLSVPAVSWLADSWHLMSLQLGPNILT